MNNKYESFFSNWLFNNLPESSEWMVIQDIDYVLQNFKTKRFIFIELKTRKNELTSAQRSFYSMLHKRMIKSNEINDWWKFIWTHLIQFEKDNFDDWYVLLNWKMINEYQLQHKLIELLF